MSAHQQQKDLFTRRWRKVRPPGAREFEIQKSLIARLRLQCRPGVLYFHVPNGEERDPRVAAKLKAMGVLPGVADLVFVWGELVSCPNLMVLPRVLFLELKARGRTQTPEQINFQSQCGAVACFYELADNIDDAVEILRCYAILPREGHSHDNINNATRAAPRAHRPPQKVLSRSRKAATTDPPSQPDPALTPQAISLKRWHKARARNQSG